MHHDIVLNILGVQHWFNTQKSSSIALHLDRLMEENHMILSVSAEKGFDKIEDPFRILRKLWTEGIFKN